MLLTPGIKTEVEGFFGVCWDWSQGRVAQGEIKGLGIYVEEEV